MKKFNTYGVKYLGSKLKILPLINEVISSVSLKNKTAIDVFTGTTRVAQMLKAEGFLVTTSDLAWASEAYSSAFICNNGEIDYLQNYVDLLNSIQPEPGWITKNYCDAEPALGTTKVQVFHPKNGMKADPARDLIETFDLTRKEKMILIASVVFALDRVDNTSGIQQSYLKDWKSKRSLDDIKFELPKQIKGPEGNHIVGDALNIAYEDAEIAYLDPPYSPRNYSSYYHIWDSVTRWDKPEVGLQTNRRVDRIRNKDNDLLDQSMASPWYSRSTALAATERLLDKLPVRYCVLSYSDEGLISFDEIKSLLTRYPRYEIFQKKHKRYIMSSIGTGAKPLTDEEFSNTEYVFLIEK
jgi:adenine-specific DNA-methyltransferase